MIIPKRTLAPLEGTADDEAVPFVVAPAAAGVQDHPAAL
jgi:hypothetical protein